MLCIGLAKKFLWDFQYIITDNPNEPFHQPNTY